MSCVVVVPQSERLSTVGSACNHLSSEGAVKDGEQYSTDERPPMAGACITRWHASLQRVTLSLRTGSRRLECLILQI